MTAVDSCSRFGSKAIVEETVGVRRAEGVDRPVKIVLARTRRPGKRTYWSVAVIVRGIAESFSLYKGRAKARADYALRLQGLKDFYTAGGRG